MNRTELKLALEAFLAAAATRNPEAIRQSLNRVQEFESQVAAMGDPRLEHFLQRRSYQKALDYLRGQEPAAGSCGERH